MKNIITALLFLVSIALMSQVKVKGKVFDDTGNPMSYTDLRFAGKEDGVISEEDGTFYIESNDTETQLIASMLGFDDVTITINPGYQEVEIHFAKFKNEEIVKVNTTEEVVVTAKHKKYKSKKENPAYAIMKKIWENRRSNGVKLRDNYEYEKYEKVEYDLTHIDSQFMQKKLFKDFEFVFKKVDTSRITGENYLPMFINESISKVYGVNKPEKKREDLMANKASGFENNYALIETVKNLYTDFDIYDNTIDLFNKPFASPLATNGFGFYDYNLVDSTETNGKKNYRIKYYPKNKNDLAFSGSFWVTDGVWSITKIDMKANKDLNVNFVNKVYIEKKYEMINDSIYVPTYDYTMLTLSLLSKKEGNHGIHAHRTMMYKDYKFDVNRPITFYDEKINKYDESLYTKDESYWAEHRHETLDKDEKGVYETLEQLNKVPRFQKIVNLVEIVSSGYIELGHNIELGSIYQLFGMNEVEGYRFRIGLRNFKTQNDRFRAKTYLAWGTDDEKFKYGVEAKYLLDRDSRWIIGGGTKRDIMQLGALVNDNDIVSPAYGSSSLLMSGSNNKLSNVNRSMAFTSVELATNAFIRLEGAYQTTKSAHPDFNSDYILDGNTYHDITDSKIAVSFVAEPGKKITGNGVERYEHDGVGAYPTIILKYTRGLKGVIDSDFNYDKLDFFYHQPFFFNTFGKLDATVGFGMTQGNVPLTLLNIAPGNQSYGYVANTFGMMNFYEFVSDQYASLFLEHHMGGRFLGRIPLIKKLKLREVFFFRGAYGTLRNDNLNMIADANLRNDLEKYNFQDNKPYYEYGFGIENIGFGNLRLFRVDFNWRGNYLDNPDARKFGMKLGMSVSF